MIEAGLGNHTTHSTHGASSTAAFLMGMPLDRIVSRVGWLRASTFIKYYMKPVKSLTKNKKLTKSNKKGVFPDPHGYATVIANMTPRVPLTHPSPKDLVEEPVDALNQPIYGPLLNIKTEHESDEFSDNVSEGDGNMVIDDEQELVTVCVENDREQDSFAAASMEMENERKQALEFFHPKITSSPIPSKEGEPTPLPDLSKLPDFADCLVINTVSRFKKKRAKITSTITSPSAATNDLAIGMDNKVHSPAMTNVNRPKSDIQFHVMAKLSQNKWVPTTSKFHNDKPNPITSTSESPQNWVWVNCSPPHPSHPPVKFPEGNITKWKWIDESKGPVETSRGGPWPLKYHAKRTWQEDCDQE